MDYTIKIGGEAGQGLQTIGEVLAKVFADSGYHVFSNQDYESRVRGGHNFYQVRVSDSPVMSALEKTDILIALDRASIELHAGEMTERGTVLYDSLSLKEKFERPGFLDVPLQKIATEVGGSPVVSNSVSVGAALGVLGMDLSILESLLKKTFAKKGEAVIESNIKSARAGFEYAVNNCKGLPATGCPLGTQAPAGKPKKLMDGIEGIAIGAIGSGLKFYAAYPMTPTTGIMNYLATKEAEYGIVVEQAEDEISAINMAIGASFAGVRAMTASSGGGFSLMVEGLSLAAMTETPIVIAEGQRPAPATGFPTRTEQGDLLFVLHAAHGEFPRVVFAPGTPAEAIRLTNKAFELAEKYQIPAFVLFDQYLADSQWTFDELEAEKLIYNDYRLRGEVLASLKDYKRHAFTDSGVSPLAVPGDSTHLVVTDSDEHNEEGHIVEDASTRIKMVDKRLFKKLVALKKEIRAPLVYGSEKPAMVLVGWGSTYGVIKETVDSLIKQGKAAAMVHFSEIYPLPEDSGYLDVLKKASVTLCVENNATAQFARFIRAETGFTFTGTINRYDGRPFSVDYILREGARPPAGMIDARP